MSPVYDLHSAFGYRLALVNRIIDRRFENALVPLGLSRVNWCILLAVGQEGHATPSDIAEFLGIDRTATSRGLRRLENDGLLTRQNGETDRRRTQVHLTQKGQDHLLAANRAAEENAAHFRAKMTEQDGAALIDILTKLTTDETRAVPNL